jgi:soluble P-type ATPase
VNLELIESSKLLEELTKRFEHVIFVGATSRESDKFQILRKWKGNAYFCVGLATDMGDWLLTDLRNRVTPT